jgi:hypothetical protein
MDTLILIGTGLGRLVELRLNARVDWDGIGTGLWLVLLSCSRGIYCFCDVMSRVGREGSPVRQVRRSWRVSWRDVAMCCASQWLRGGG